MDLPGRAEFLPISCATTSTISVSANACDDLAASVLGVVSIASQVFMRAGSSLTLQASSFQCLRPEHHSLLQRLLSDTWKMKPTLTSATDWAGPGDAPVEAQGKPGVLVDAANQPVRH